MIKRPIISEKSMELSKSGLYTFEVDKNATKEQIKKLVEEIFKVDVEDVRSVNIQGKVKLQRTRKGYYRTSPIKKALVKVKKGQRITLFEHIDEEEKEDVVVTTGEGEPITVKEKKSMLKGTKVKIEKEEKPKKTAKKKEEKK